MSLVGLNTRRGELRTYKFGSGEPVATVTIPELKEQNLTYQCRIWPAGDQTYVVGVQPDENIRYTDREPWPQVFVVYPDKSVRLERPKQLSGYFADQYAHVFDQNPVAPEVFLVAWKSSREPKSVLQVWSVLPELTLLDEWPLEEFVYGGRFPEVLGPVERKDILIELSTTNKDKIRPKEVAVPLSASARLTDEWFVTPYGRLKSILHKSFLGPIRINIRDYGLGTTPLRSLGADLPFSWVSHPIYRLRTAENKAVDIRGALVKHLYDARTDRLSPIPIPEAFITDRDFREGGQYGKVADGVQCVIVDTVDLDWTGERLFSVLARLLRSEDLASYVLRAYQPSMIFPGMKKETTAAPLQFDWSRLFGPI